MSFLLTSGMNPQAIYERITKKFTYPGGSGTKRKDDTIFFSGAFDEPTYLTFHIDFDFECMDENSSIMSGEGYNDLPHALLNIIDYDYGHPNASEDSEEDMDGFAGRDVISGVKLSANDAKYIINDYNTVSNKQKNVYSAYNYLKYSQGEIERARMLVQFKAGLYDLVKYCPYYFTSISGLGQLMQIDTKSGVRIPESKNIITITCNEALDLRITQIMNLYRKIAWDDVYQRWVLPDIMRYFKMYIYISEMRVFHTAKNNGLSALLGTAGTLTNIIGGQNNPVSNGISKLSAFTADDFKLLSHSINEAMPTIKLECSLCEFDMSDLMAHVNNLKSSKNDEQLAPTIKIHVGNIKEIQSYGLSKDYLLNGSENLINHIYTDNALITSATNYTSDNGYKGKMYRNDAGAYAKGKNDISGITPSDLLTSNTVLRLGTDVMKDDKNNDYKYSPFERDAVFWAKKVTGAIQKFVGSDALQLLGVNTMSDTKYTSKATQSGPIEHQLLAALRQSNPAEVSSAVRKVFNGNKDYIFSVPIGYGIKVGDLASSALTGNMAPIFSSIKEYAMSNYATEELRDTYNVESGFDFLKDILTNIAQSTATTDTDSRFIETTIQILENSHSAADIGQTIDDMYDDYLKQLSNEAIEDTDNGYIQPNLETAPYTSTANNGNISSPYNPSLHGTSNEANVDEDHGYSIPGIHNTPYRSTANAGVIGPLYDLGLHGTSNEAVSDTDSGYNSPSIANTPYRSTANEGTVGDLYNKDLHGTSNEAVEDSDSGYNHRKINNPQYRSTANNMPIVEGTTPTNPDPSSEANEDTDHGYSNIAMKDNAEKALSHNGKKVIIKNE